jgi:hypothetical protein
VHASGGGTAHGIRAREEATTMKKQYGPKYEKERRRMDALKLDVLRYLKKHGPQNSTILYVHFDPHHTGDIDPVQRDLLAWHDIELKGERISITESGLRLLERLEAEIQ